MLVLAVVLLALSAVFAIGAALASLGVGGRILPGYRFRARGAEAKKWERKLLSTVACFLWSVAVFLSAAGVAVFFLDLKTPLHILILCVLGGFFIIVTVLWAIFLSGGSVKDAAKKAKELSD
ncbi:MAG: hypothetical protein IJU84_04710 [Clostridia bacterium]|nr:hypothetical protein [Clostridia bacterium]